MGGTPDTDNDDDHFQTHPTEQSTGNIQLAAAVLLFFSILLHYCYVCRRGRDDACASEAKHMGR